MNRISKVISTAFVAGLALALVSFASFAESEFEGVWAVKSSGGKPFEITLAADGKATATLAEAMVGTWKQEGDSAVITWDTGWTTKITKEGDRYVKTAFKKGETDPANTSDAQKVK